VGICVPRTQDSKLVTSLYPLGWQDEQPLFITRLFQQWEMRFGFLEIEADFSKHERAPALSEM
jgi:hypothetical protein